MLYRSRQSLQRLCGSIRSGISGLVAEYIVAIDVNWVRFPADAQQMLFKSAKSLQRLCGGVSSAVSGPVAEYMAAIDVARITLPCRLQYAGTMITTVASACC